MENRIEEYSVVATKAKEVRLDGRKWNEYQEFQVFLLFCKYRNTVFCGVFKIFYRSWDIQNLSKIIDNAVKEFVFTKVWCVHDKRFIQV